MVKLLKTEGEETLLLPHISTALPPVGSNLMIVSSLNEPAISSGTELGGKELGLKAPVSVSV